MRIKEEFEGHIHAVIKQATARCRAKASTRPEDEGWSEGIHRKETPAEKRARKGEERQLPRPQTAAPPEVIDLTETAAEAEGIIKIEYQRPKAG